MYEIPLVYVAATIAVVMMRKKILWRPLAAVHFVAGGASKSKLQTTTHSDQLKSKVSTGPRDDDEPHCIIASGNTLCYRFLPISPT